MAETIEIEASDGHRLSACRVVPAGPRRGGVVVIQEVFGVNAHIRRVCERFAAAGYEALAPALFDRIARGVELDYDETGIARGRELVAELGWQAPLADVEAARRTLAAAGRVGAVGYCWGGSVTYLAACRLSFAAAAVYYGRHIVDLLDQRPACPTIMHFGAADPLIPLANVEAIRTANPDVPIFVYDGAGHGFNCEARADYRADAAALALDRTLALFAQHVG
ncbi:MAG: dienelactone hydrolase family protein [Rhodospirillales bacterium]|jgi:carboxymethylenebutenolidase|nr:dienelactone hydrolase family protein [Rhodospirillales bacterium]